MDCSPLGFSIHGIRQARILEWVAILFSEDLPNSGIKPQFLCISCIGRKILYHLYHLVWLYKNVSLHNQIIDFFLHSTWWTTQRISLVLRSHGYSFYTRHKLLKIVLFSFLFWAWFYYCFFLPKVLSSLLFPIVKISMYILQYAINTFWRLIYLLFKSCEILFSEYFLLWPHRFHSSLGLLLFMIGVKLFLGLLFLNINKIMWFSL